MLNQSGDSTMKIQVLIELHGKQTDDGKIEVYEGSLCLFRADNVSEVCSELNRLIDYDTTSIIINQEKVG
jgi:hypothetical protein